MCNQEITVGDKSPFSRYGYQHLHRRCFNGLRCLERLVSKRSDLREQVKDCRYKDPEKFKGICTSLVTAEKHKRHRDQRVSAISFVESLTKTNSVSRIRKVVLLPKEQYIHWYCYNYLMTDTAAAEKWNRGLQGPDIHREIEDGRVVIAMRQPTEIHGTETTAQQMSVKLRDQEMSEHSARKRLAEGNLSLSADEFAEAGGDILRTGAASFCMSRVFCLDSGPPTRNTQVFIYRFL